MPTLPDPGETAAHRRACTGRSAVYRDVEPNASPASIVRKPVRVSFSPVSGRTQIGSQISIGGPGWQQGAAGWQQGAVRHGTGAKPGHGLHSPPRVGGGRCQPWQPTAPARNNRIVKLTPPRFRVMVCMPVLSGGARGKKFVARLKKGFKRLHRSCCPQSERARRVPIAPGTLPRRLWRFRTERYLRQVGYNPQCRGGAASPGPN